MNGQSRNGYREKSYAIASQENLAVRDDAAAAFRFAGSGILRRMRAELAAAWAACGMFEYVALTYLGVSVVLISLFAANVAHPLRLLGTQAFVAAAILALCRAAAHLLQTADISGQARCKAHEECTLARSPAAATQSLPTLAHRFWHFWRCWYPHLFFLFCFEEMGKFVHLVQPAWQDGKLIAFDYWLTGVNPSVWLERFSRPALNEFMQFAYFTYFLFLLILGGLLYHRRENKSYWEVMTYSAVAYSLGYVIATIFPVQSPWFTLAGMWHADLTGGPFTALINLIEKCGRVHGAAFPSQHVAGATAALWGAWRHRRWLFWVFLPFVVCMCASTVYVRNHYVADVLAGLVTGTLGYVIGGWLMGNQDRQKAK